MSNIFFENFSANMHRSPRARKNGVVCDTFRAGAVEQLRTHVHRINGVHPEQVKLFEQGYGKDAATIAMHAISAARDQQYDVVLIDRVAKTDFQKIHNFEIKYWQILKNP